MLETSEPELDAKVPFNTFDEATDHLEKMCIRLGVRHMSYWKMTSHEGVPEDITWIATYDPAYMSQYMTQYTPLGDPAFDAAVSGVEAIDWSDLSSTDVTAMDMHRKAERYGIGRHGLTFPLIVSEECKVLFSVNVNCVDAEWASEKVRVTGPARELGLRFHDRMMFLIDNRRAAPASR